MSSNYVGMTHVQPSPAAAAPIRASHRLAFLADDPPCHVRIGEITECAIEPAMTLARIAINKARLRDACPLLRCRGADLVHDGKPSQPKLGVTRWMASVDTSNPATDVHLKTGHHAGGLRLVIGSA